VTSEVAQVPRPSCKRWPSERMAAAARSVHERAGLGRTCKFNVQLRSKDSDCTFTAQRRQQQACAATTVWTGRAVISNQLVGVYKRLPGLGRAPPALPCAGRHRACCQRRCRRIAARLHMQHLTMHTS
jgi:hypothetical protein